ncbi:MAG: response regulator [Parafilimonas sp.]
MPDRFMVIDDDAINNMICKLLIQRCFNEVNIKLFTEPEDALTAINFEYTKKGKMLSTVLFLDINMPVMTGWEFLEVFKNFNSSIQQQFTIFVLSSSIDYKDEEKAKSNPLVAGFICKPLTAEKIMEMVSNAQKILA